MQKIMQNAPIALGRNRHGLSGWILCRLEKFGKLRTGQHAEMRRIETLALGGKRQLMLVSCGNERYLVGGGSESVDCIVRIASTSIHNESSDHCEAQ